MEGVGASKLYRHSQSDTRDGVLVPFGGSRCSCGDRFFSHCSSPVLALFLELYSLLARFPGPSLCVGVGVCVCVREREGHDGLQFGDATE